MNYYPSVTKCSHQRSFDGKSIPWRMMSSNGLSYIDSRKTSMSDHNRSIVLLEFGNEQRTCTSTSTLSNYHDIGWEVGNGWTKYCGTLIWKYSSKKINMKRIVLLFELKYERKLKVKKEYSCWEKLPFTLPRVRNTPGVYHMLVVYAEPFNLYIKKKDTFVRNEK
jgi:hypothetical protein